MELVRSAADAFRRGDWDALATTLDPDILIRADPRWPEQRAYGREAAIALYRDIWESWGTDVSYEGIMDLGDRLLIRLHWIIRGPRSGVEGELTSSEIVTFRDSRVILVEFFIEHGQALKALELEE